MITDKNLVLSAAQDIGQVAGTYDSDNVVDLRDGIAARQDVDIGAGYPLKVACGIGDAVASGGAATLEIQVVVSAAAALTSPVILGTTGVLGFAALHADARFAITINQDIAGTLGAALRYLGLQIIIAAATTTAGTLYANVCMDAADGERFYASGFTVA